MKAYVMQFDSRVVEQKIRQWAEELGFSVLGISGTGFEEAGARLAKWLEKGFHGEMNYMAKHAALRSKPAELHPGTVSVITLAMSYCSPHFSGALEILENRGKAYVSRYALGRDYHKVMRRKLQSLLDRMEAEYGGNGRVFVDSAPVLEVEAARKSGMGWRGKHTLLLTKQGSYFFLGEIFTNLPLRAGDPVPDHCGSCTKCIDICPTQAIVEPYVLDARRCISYLTIEHPGPIPLEYREAMGNRIYGCDDCQLVCPWNRFSKIALEPDFAARNGLEKAELVTLFSWSKEEFDSRLAGSAIRRIGHERWLRNIAVALGNSESSEAVVSALKKGLDHESGLVREHVAWALDRHSG